MMRFLFYFTLTFFLMLLSCDYGDYGVFAKILDDASIEESQFSDEITVLGLAETGTETTGTVRYISYGKLSTDSTGSWTEVRLPENSSNVSDITAIGNSVYAIIREGDSVNASLYVYEVRGNKAIAWYQINLPKDHAKYVVMDKIFNLNNKLFLIVRDAGKNNPGNSSKSKILELSNLQNSPVTVSEYVKTEGLPLIQDACFTMGRYWFLSRATLYSVQAGNKQLKQHSISITVDGKSVHQKGEFLGISPASTSDSNSVLYVSSIEKIYAYSEEGGSPAWKASKTISNAVFSSFAYVPKINWMLIGSRKYGKFTSSYSPKGLHHILADGDISKLDSPKLFDKLDDVSITELLTLKNGNVLVGSTGTGIWEIEYKGGALADIKKL